MLGILGDSAVSFRPRLLKVVVGPHSVDADCRLSLGLSRSIFLDRDSRSCKAFPSLDKANENTSAEFAV